MAEHLHYPDGYAGQANPCSCAIGRDHAPPNIVIGYADKDIPAGGTGTVKLENWLTLPRPVPEGVVEAQAAINSAIKLAKDNPPMEPMQYGVSRTTIERMLVTDIDELGYETVENMAKKLFDLGWRPNVERLSR